MIADKTFFEYLFQFMVITQPALWMYLYDSDINFPESFKTVVYACLFSLAMPVIGNQIQIGFYTTTILVQYIILLAVSFYLYNTRKPVRESLALSFLTVFLNSFYWELPLHIVEWFTVGFYPAQLVQLVRLAPAVFIAYRFTFTKPQKRTILLGLVFSSCMILWKMTPPRTIIKATLIYAFNRLMTTVILTKTIIEAEPRT